MQIRQRIANSRSGLYISRILANSGGILPAEIKQIVGPYLDNVEKRLQQNQNGITPPSGDGFLNGIGQMVQQRVNQFGTEVNNGQLPMNFLPGQGGGQPNQGSGSFFGAGPGGQNGATANPGWGNQLFDSSGNVGNTQRQPGGWPVSQPQLQPLPSNNNWPNNSQTGFGGHQVLPR